MFVLIHFGEIALKGKNRGFFERILVENIKKTLGKGFFKSIKIGFGRIILELSENANLRLAEEKLKSVFGIANFAFVLKSVSNIEALKEKALVLLEKENFKTFAVKTQRADKSIVFSSQDVNKELGSLIVEKLNKKVDLNQPEIILFVEITQKEAFLFVKKVKGLGGLPVNVSGKAVCLLSGGIDSPVACFLGLKRGLEIILVHFQSAPYSNLKSIEKVEDLAEKLSKYQTPLKLYLLPFAEIQKEILLKTKECFRVILYRRAMLTIAQKIAQKERAKALITGDNLGQVASQTIENLISVENAVNLLVLRPLICYDKEEIIAKSKQLGFFETSILPYDDCCSRFLPKMPETRSCLKDVLKEEKNLVQLNVLLENSLKNVQIKQF